MCAKQILCVVIAYDELFLFYIMKNFFNIKLIDDIVYSKSTQEKNTQWSSDVFNTHSSNIKSIEIWGFF